MTDSVSEETAQGGDPVGQMDSAGARSPPRVFGHSLSRLNRVAIPRDDCPDEVPTASGPKSSQASSSRWADVAELEGGVLTDKEVEEYKMRVAGPSHLRETGWSSSGAPVEDCAGARGGRSTA